MSCGACFTTNGRGSLRYFVTIRVYCAPCSLLATRYDLIRASASHKQVVCLVSRLYSLITHQIDHLVLFLSGTAIWLALIETSVWNVVIQQHLMKKLKRRLSAAFHGRAGRNAVPEYRHENTICYGNPSHMYSSQSPSRTWSLSDSLSHLADRFVFRHFL